MDVMTDTLPIIIKPSRDLSAKFSHILSIANKLEAQLNFHTLTANWYGDEAEVLMVSFDLITMDELNQITEQEKFSLNEQLADDVILLAPATLERHCYVAITASETALLIQKPKLLSGYLAKKLTKVLNVIASREALAAI